MPIFIKENQALNNNMYEIPDNLESHLKDTLAKYGSYSNLKGYKRLNSLVNPNYNKRSNKEDSFHDGKHISFSDMKRIDHDFRHMSKNPNNIERKLNGGDEMAHFVKSTLDRERTKVSPVLKQKKVETRNKNAVKPTVKPTQPVKSENVSESIKIIYINENQINILNKNKK